MRRTLNIVPLRPSLYIKPETDIGLGKRRGRLIIEPKLPILQRRGLESYQRLKQLGEEDWLKEETKLLEKAIVKKSRLYPGSVEIRRFGGKLQRIREKERRLRELPEEADAFRRVLNYAREEDLFRRNLQSGIPLERQERSDWIRNNILPGQSFNRGIELVDKYLTGLTRLIDNHKRSRPELMNEINRRSDVLTRELKKFRYSLDDDLTRIWETYFQEHAIQLSLRDIYSCERPRDGVYKFATSGVNNDTTKAFITDVIEHRPDIVASQIKFRNLVKLLMFETLSLEHGFPLSVDEDTMALSGMYKNINYFRSYGRLRHVREVMKPGRVSKIIKISTPVWKTDIGEVGNPELIAVYRGFAKNTKNLEGLYWGIYTSRKPLNQIQMTDKIRLILERDFKRYETGLRVNGRSRQADELIARGRFSDDEVSIEEILLVDDENRISLQYESFMIEEAHLVDGEPVTESVSFENLDGIFNRLPNSEFRMIGSENDGTSGFKMSKYLAYVGSITNTMDPQEMIKRGSNYNLLESFLVDALYIDTYNGFNRKARLDDFYSASRYDYLNNRYVSVYCAHPDTKRGNGLRSIYTVKKDLVNTVDTNIYHVLYSPKGVTDCGYKCLFRFMSENGLLSEFKIRQFNQIKKIFRGSVDAVGSLSHEELIELGKRFNVNVVVITSAKFEDDKWSYNIVAGEMTEGNDCFIYFNSLHYFLILHPNMRCVECNIFYTGIHKCESTVMKESQAKLELRALKKKERYLRNIDDKNSLSYITTEIIQSLTKLLSIEGSKFLNTKLKNKFCKMIEDEVFNGDEMPDWMDTRSYNIIKKCLEVSPRLMKFNFNKLTLGNRLRAHFVFDYETIVEQYQRLYPYSVCGVKTEWDSQAKDLIYNPETDIIKSVGTCEGFLKSITEAAIYGTNYLIGFNNQKFDNYILLSSILSMFGKYVDNDKLIFNNGRIMRMEWTDGKGKRFILVDLLNYMAKNSLKNICRDMKVPAKYSKLDVDHTAIQNKRDEFKSYNEFIKYLGNKDNKIEYDIRKESKEKYGEYTKSKVSVNMLDILKYNVHDCLATAYVFFSVSETIRELTGEDMLDSVTLPGISYKLFKNDTKISIKNPLYKFKDRESVEENNAKIARVKEMGYEVVFESKQVHTLNFYPWMIPETRQFLFYREACIAGRSQIFHRSRDGYVTGRFVMFDVVSLYPFVMLGREYPVGNSIETKEYVSGKMGIYKCIVSNQPKVKIIPNRVKGKPLDWTYEGTIHATLTSVDIETLRRNKATVEITEGVYWKETMRGVDLFESLIKIKVEKQKQDRYKDSKDPAERAKYNPSIRNLCKNLLNSLYGKLIQRLFATKNAFLYPDSPELYEWLGLNTTDIIDMGKSVTTGKNLPSLVSKLDEKDANKNLHPAHLGCFVLSYARTHMYEAVYKHDFAKLTDTDSAAFDMSDPKVEKFCQDSLKNPCPTLTEEDWGDKDKLYKALGDRYCKFNLAFGNNKEFGDFDDESCYYEKYGEYINGKFEVTPNQDKEYKRVYYSQSCGVISKVYSFTNPIIETYKNGVINAKESIKIWNDKEERWGDEVPDKFKFKGLMGKDSLISITTDGVKIFDFSSSALTDKRVYSALGAGEKVEVETTQLRRETKNIKFADQSLFLYTNTTKKVFCADKPEKKKRVNK